MYPKEPPAAGTPVQTFEGANTTYTWRTIDGDHWLVDGPPGVQTAIERSEAFEGAFDFLQTNGSASRTALLSEWRDLGKYFT